MRGTLRCKDNVRPAVSMLSPLGAPSFSPERINLPPFTYPMEAQKFERRLPAARRYIVEHLLNEHFPGAQAPPRTLLHAWLRHPTPRTLPPLALPHPPSPPP